MATVTLRGMNIRTSGELPVAGTVAPDFILVDQKLDNKSLADFRGRKKLLIIVPSLDTPVCATSGKRFNELLAGTDAVALLVSADLPFAMGRFCKGAGLRNVVPLSMMRSRQFARDYGVLMLDGPLAGITARAVVAVDEDNVVIYTELVTEISHEPDYDRALAAL